MNWLSSYRKYFIGLIIIFTAVFLAKTSEKSSVSKLSNYKTINASIKSSKFILYVSDTEEKRSQGLSNIDHLEKNEGMLFTFPQSGHYSFWMKDMQFPLDFIFIDGNRVVDTMPNISPNTYPQAFTASQPVDKVIELTAGSIQKNFLNVGDALTLQP